MIILHTCHCPRSELEITFRVLYPTRYTMSTMCHAVLQELRRMSSRHQMPSMIERRNSMFVGDVVADASQIKSEMMIQQHKFDRLEYKEKRLQVLYTINRHHQSFHELLKLFMIVLNISVRLFCDSVSSS